jgi:hypothetical protein
MAMETREEREARERIDRARQKIGEVYQVFERRIMDMPSVHTSGFDHERITIEVYRESEFFKEEFEKLCTVLNTWCDKSYRPRIPVKVEQKRNEHRLTRWIEEEDAGRWV